MLIWLNWETLLTLPINSIMQCFVALSQPHVCIMSEWKHVSPWREAEECILFQCVSNRLNSSCDAGVTFTVAVAVNFWLSREHSLGFVCRWQMCLLFTICDGFSENNADRIAWNQRALLCFWLEPQWELTTCRSFNHANRSHLWRDNFLKEDSFYWCTSAVRCMSWTMRTIRGLVLGFTEG